MPIDLIKIKRLREELKLTQAEAAERAGFGSRQAWYAVESGNQEPMVSTLERMAKALGVKAKDLLK